MNRKMVPLIPRSWSRGSGVTTGTRPSFWQHQTPVPFPPSRDRKQLNGKVSRPGTKEIQPARCLDCTHNQLGIVPNPAQGGIAMRTDRRRFWISLILLVLPLTFALSARAQADGKYRWDIVHISSFNPVTAFPGGFASALANDESKITVSGAGTFVPQE